MSIQNNGEPTIPQSTENQPTTENITLLNETDFKVWRDAYFENLDKKEARLEAERLVAIPAPAPAPVSTMPMQTTTPMPTPDPMETTEARIKFLENAIAPLKKNFVKAVDFDYKKFEELNTLAGELTDLKSRVEKERVIKDRYRNKYAGTFATNADFEHLWVTRLRDEALQAEFAIDKTLKEVRKTDLYQTW